jgi:hypothetical protein
MPRRIVVPAAAVDTFRELAYRDYSTFAERLPRCHQETDFEDQYAMVEEGARLMDALGWDEPTKTDCAVTVEDDFIRGLLVGTLEAAISPLEGGASAAEEREAQRQVRSCLLVWEALGGSEA